MELIYASFNTPFGLLYFAKSRNGICGVALEDETPFLRKLEERFGKLPLQNPSSFSELIERFHSYFRGEKVEFNPPIDLRGLTEFQKRVLLEVKKIPYGKLKSYGEIATFMGKPRASRAVGQALSKNPLLILIPCHRVILKSGGLGGFGYGVSLKEKLLRLENAWPL